MWLLAGLLAETMRVQTWSAYQGGATSSFVQHFPSPVSVGLTREPRWFYSWAISNNERCREGESESISSLMPLTKPFVESAPLKSKKVHMNMARKSRSRFWSDDMLFQSSNGLLHSLTFDYCWDYCLEIVVWMVGIVTTVSARLAVLLRKKWPACPCDVWIWASLWAMPDAHRAWRLSSTTKRLCKRVWWAPWDGVTGPTSSPSPRITISGTTLAGSHAWSQSTLQVRRDRIAHVTLSQQR